MNIFEQLKKLGFETVPADFYSANIDLWQQWYEGKVNKFHNYRIYNGAGGYVKQERYSCGMAKKVCEDWANLLMNEKVNITLEGEAEQDFFDEVCKENNFAVKANELQEKKAALGTGAYVFSVTDVPINPESGAISGEGKNIKIDYVTARHIVPLSWENGRVKECAFLIVKTVKGKKYTYCQIHRISGDEYLIENSLYRNDGESLSSVELSEVEGFENIPATVHTGSDKPQFVVDKLNIANNADMDNPMGISVFANALDQLKGVDVAYDSYVNEFILGKKRIMVKPSAMKDLETGEYAFDANDVTFYMMPEDSKDESVIHEIDMTLRTDAHKMGIQDMLNMLSTKCGFGESHYKFENGGITTATEVISQNSTMFRTIRKHEIILEDVLIEIARIILRLGNTYLGQSLDEDVEISVDFDDSIIEDEATNFQRDVQMLSMGIIQPYEFRMKWMNEDEETARAALPQMEQLVQDETGADEV